MAFFENGGHSFLIVKVSQCLGLFLSPELGRVGDCLVILVCNWECEEFRVDIACRALEPDIEKVRELRVHDIVIVGRIHDYGVDALSVDVVKMVRWCAGEGDLALFPAVDEGEQGKADWSFFLLFECFDVDVRVEQGGQFGKTFFSLFKSPVVTKACNQGRHFCV